MIITIFIFSSWAFDKHTVSFALIHLTEINKKVLDQGKYGCGIFVDLNKAFQ